MYTVPLSPLLPESPYEVGRVIVPGSHGKLVAGPYSSYDLATRPYVLLTDLTLNNKPGDLLPVGDVSGRCA